ncbi:EthD domain-containing protein [Promicromonospora sukumoe]|uniref:EthD domain-containing protein n=1 Tax=Promicromonospora sukumoe TaxID=88382 RepID=UPI00035F86E4|nr:EthD domain-containing protein [Promicromonospora sukumoe]
MPEELTLITLIRKRPEVSTEAFRAFMEHDYGPTYTRMVQVESYVQHYVTELANDGSEDPIDAIVQITFTSREGMREALATDEYQRAHAARSRFMRATTAGIHTVRVERSVVPGGGHAAPPTASDRS